jgi:phenolic acid decarboxylase
MSIDDDEYCLFKTCWKNDQVQLYVNFSKNYRTLPKSHMHIFDVSIYNNNCARFEECQLKGVRGVDYTK